VERQGREARCVFCGNAIAPGEASVGRGAVAAHAACADRSLGDEGSWDRIAAALGDGAPAEDHAAADGDPVATDATGRDGSDAGAAPGASPSGGRSRAAAARSGCLVIAMLVPLVVLVPLVAWSVMHHALGSRKGG
jgi:hypothetical protein